VRRAIYDITELFEALSGGEWDGTVGQFLAELDDVARSMIPPKQKESLHRQARQWLVQEYGADELASREAAARGVML
jgi:hypothetical protein